MKRCSACKQRWYCDKGCQTAGWKNHKAFCRRIQHEVHLLPSTSDAAAPFDDRAQRMYRAVDAGDVRLVRSLLDAGVYVNVRHPEGGLTALHGAAGVCPEGRVCAMIELLRERGADTETRDTTEGRFRPIDHAASEGRGAAVAALKAAGASVQVPEDDGRGLVLGPLHAAAQQGHADVCRTLLDFGSAVDALCGGHVVDGGRAFGTPLYIAAQKGHVAVVDLLLARGADPLVRGQPHGNTVLGIAAQEGHVPVCRALWAHEAARVRVTA